LSTDRQDRGTMFVVALRPVDDDSDRTRRRDRPPADRPAPGARVTVAVWQRGATRPGSIPGSST